VEKTNENAAGESAKIRGALKARLEMEQMLGIESLPTKLPPKRTGERKAPFAARQTANAPIPSPFKPAPYAASKPSPAAKKPAAPVRTGNTVIGAPPELSDELKTLREKVETCRKCPLGGTRKNAVFGEGNSKAGLMFVGEAPGYHEDVQGRPFVGPAGMLLTKIIEAIKLERKDVFIANILKCRPPENRTPQPDEVAACRGHLEAQIDLIKPKIICALGGPAAKTLLNKPNEGITKMRGTWHEYKGIPVMPTFHPAYLLRNPADKKYCWEDMQNVRDRLKGVENQK
jgi:DNA polymerase